MKIARGSYCSTTPQNEWEIRTDRELSPDMLAILEQTVMAADLKPSDVKSITWHGEAPPDIETVPWHKPATT